MFVFDVGGFADVGVHVEEAEADLGLPVAVGDAACASGAACHGAVSVRKVQFPFTGAEGLELIAVVKVVGLLRGFGGITGEEWPDVFAVDAVLGEFGADQVRNGGEEINGHGGFLADAVGGDGAGHPCEGRFAASAVKHGAFSLT